MDTARRNSSSFRALLVLAGIAAMFAATGGSCDDDLVQNPGFDVWCGEHLCAWEVERGRVERIPTWHPKDHGVLLIGDPVVLTQYVDSDQERTTCFEFELQGDLDDGVDLYLEMDFLDDGVVEYAHPIPLKDWKTIHYHLGTPSWYDGVRFIVRKEGGAAARLAQIRVFAGQGCTSDPMPLQHRPSGAPCLEDHDCESLDCVEGRTPPCAQDSAACAGFHSACR